MAAPPRGVSTRRRSGRRGCARDELRDLVHGRTWERDYLFVFASAVAHRAPPSSGGAAPPGTTLPGTRPPSSDVATTCEPQSAFAHRADMDAIAVLPVATAGGAGGRPPILRPVRRQAGEQL
jgi:hypothetical protein